MHLKYIFEPINRVIGQFLRQSTSFRILWTLWDTLGYFGIIWDALGCSDMLLMCFYEPINQVIGPFLRDPRPVLGYSEYFGILWDTLGLSGMLWDAQGWSAMLFELLLRSSQ